MSTSQSPNPWFKHVPVWYKATIATVTGIVSLVLTLRQNFQLFVVAAMAMAFVALFVGCVRLLTERNINADGQSTGEYRFARYRPWAKTGIAAILLALGLLLAAKPSRSVVMVALVGTPTATLIPTATASPTYTPVPPPTATPLAFATAAPDETLILIAEFHVTAATNTEPHVKIRRRIEEELARLGETKAHVAIEPTVLRADARAEAEALGKRYNADMVIWGEDTGVEVRVDYLNLRRPDFAAAEATIAETTRVQLANPEAYAQFITQDLPGQMTFFALFAVAQAYYINADFSRSITVLESAVALSTSDMEPMDWAIAYFRLGWLYQQPAIYDLDKAIQSYGRGIDLAPNLLPAYNNRGIAYDDLGEYELALADYTKAIELDPNAAYPYSSHCYVLYALVRYAESLSSCERAVELAPDDPFTLLFRAAVYAALGRTEEAAADYGRVLELTDDPQYIRIIQMGLQELETNPSQ